MPLHPQIEQALKALADAGLPPIENLSPVEARDLFDAMAKARGGTPLAIGGTEDAVAPAPGGDIPLRIYRPIHRPEEATGPLPALLYFHGGGHVVGNLDTHDLIARNLCGGAGVVVVSVDYRMGPEHRFPAAVDDSWAAFRWLVESAGRLGVDPARLAVAGDSAGGNLAAVVAILARDAGMPNIRLQALVYPVADYTCRGDSYDRYATGYGVLTRGAMEWFREHYLSSVDDAENWRASPIKAASLAGLAPALVITAECDVLHDEGARYAEALRAAGTPVEYKEYPGMIHGFFGMTPAVDDAIEAQRHVAGVLKRALF